MLFIIFSIFYNQLTVTVAEIQYKRLKAELTNDGMLQRFTKGQKRKE